MNKKNVEAIYQLSLSQQGMLFETLVAPESGLHIEQSSWNLSGKLDIPAFKQAWQQVIERHSALRTCFVWKNLDEPLQVVLQRVKLSLEEEDWRNFSSSQQQKKLAEYFTTVRLDGFNLSKAPLMRLALFRIGEHGYQFVWTVHHILIDGWCLPLIMKEVLAFYEAFMKGNDLTLQPAHPYVNYITWLKNRDLSQAEAFWRKRLHEFTRPTPLGIDAKSEDFSNQEKHYDEKIDCLSASTTATLQSLAKQHHVTLSIPIQGLWALLLSRYSDNSDVLFGVTVSGRPVDLPGIETMMGFFINTLPIRVKVSPDVLFWSWVKKIQAQNLEQRPYEYCSAGQIQQWSEVPGALSLYESILIFENYPIDLSIPETSSLTIDINSSRFIGAQTKYALTILVIPGSELTFRIVYDRRRFDPSDITLILEHFLALLKAIVDVPEQRLATLLNRIPGEQIPHVKSLQTCAQQNLKPGFVPPRTSTENMLATIWKEIMGLEQVGIHDNFFDLGGHSLLITQVISRVNEALQVKLPLRSFSGTPTIANFARLITTIRQGELSPELQDTTLDLQTEATLDPAIHPEKPFEHWISEPSSVFLTGATGFLGAFLLYELLQQTQAKIYCLVRAPNEKEGRERIQKTLESYEIWEEQFGSRIIPVLGDLSQPRLGLSVEQFDSLAKQLDVIYHNGAFVNFVYPYYALKPANVLGTQEVLRLAGSFKVKPVHYISTLSVFDSTSYSKEKVFYEHEQPNYSEGLIYGYAQSKLVAEKLVTIARSRGFPVCIYRPGMITGHSQTGIWNTNDFGCRMIKGCIQLGSAPAMDVMVAMTPVDYISKAIIHLSKQQNLLGQVFHLVNPQPLPWNNQINWVNSFGYSIQQIAYEQWQTKLMALAAQHSPENALQPFLAMFLESDTNPQERGAQRFDCQKTLTGLAGSSIMCPPVDESLLTTYFSYFIRSGFLSSP